MGGRRHRQPDRQPERRDNQAQGAVIEGMSHLMAWEITFTAAAPCRATSTSTSRCAWRRRREIDVHFLMTDNPPTGLGEPALPPTVGALATRSRRHRQADPLAAAGEERFPLGVNHEGHEMTNEHEESEGLIGFVLVVIFVVQGTHVQA